MTDYNADHVRSFFLFVKKKKEEPTRAGSFSYAFGLNVKQ